MPELPPINSKLLSGRFSTYGLAAAVVIVCGVVPRLDQLGRSLSIAESWVANSVLAGSIREMLYSERWLQTTPPLFLTLARVVVKIFGASDVTLRAVPLTLGILALVVLARLAGAMLRPPFALVCTALVAMSPYAIAYSKELKQYSSDVFTTCLVLWAIWMYVRFEDHCRYAILLFVFAVTLLLSYTVIVFVPLAIVVLLLGKRPVAARCTGLLALTGMLGGMDYFCFIHPNSSVVLKAFWAAGFPPAGYGMDALHFYLEHFATMPFYFYFPAGPGVKDVLRILWDAMPGIVQGAAVIAALMGIAFAARSLLSRNSERYALLFFLVPLLALAALNRAGLYPVSSRRLMLFMLPCVALASAAVLQSLWVSLRELWIRRSPLLLRQAMRINGTALLLLTVAALAAHPGTWDIDTSEDGGMETAVWYLKAEVRSDSDLVYVHGWEEEPARLYMRIFHWQDVPVRYGHTGYPCCKRITEARPQSVAAEVDYVLRDFRNVIGQQSDGDLWLVLPEPRPEWGPATTDEPKIITGSMYSSGCREVQEKRFESVDVYDFHCVGPPLRLVSSFLHSD